MGEPARALASSRTMVWREGETRVFAAPEEAREFVSQPLSDAEVERGLRALRMAGDLRQEFMQRTGGHGLSEADIEDALQASREH